MTMRTKAPGLAWAQIGRDHILSRGGQEIAKLVHIDQVAGLERWRVRFGNTESSPLALVVARRVAESVPSYGRRTETAT